MRTRQVDERRKDCNSASLTQPLAQEELHQSIAFPALEQFIEPLGYVRPEERPGLPTGKGGS